MTNRGRDDDTRTFFDILVLVLGCQLPVLSYQLSCDGEERAVLYCGSSADVGPALRIVAEVCV